MQRKFFLERAEGGFRTHLWRGERETSPIYGGLPEKVGKAPQRLGGGKGRVSNTFTQIPSVISNADDPQ